MSKTQASESTLFSTLTSYLPSFVALTAFAGLYSGVVFYNQWQSVPPNTSASQKENQKENQKDYQSQSFNVAKKLSAEKASTDTVVPARDVASPLETE